MAALALLGGTATAVTGVGSIGAPNSACGISPSLMNEAFAGGSFGAGTAIPDDSAFPGERCSYAQGPNPGYDDGLIEVTAVRQEAADARLLEAFRPLPDSPVELRGERSSVPIYPNSSAVEGGNGGAYMACTTGDALWMIAAGDDPSGVSIQGLDTIAHAIGCDPVP